MGAPSDRGGHPRDGGSPADRRRAGPLGVDEGAPRDRGRSRAFVSAGVRTGAPRGRRGYPACVARQRVAAPAHGERAAPGERRARVAGRAGPSGLDGEHVRADRDVRHRGHVRGPPGSRTGRHRPDRSSDPRGGSHGAGRGRSAGRGWSARRVGRGRPNARTRLRRVGRGDPRALPAGRGGAPGGPACLPERRPRASPGGRRHGVHRPTRHAGQGPRAPGGARRGRGPPRGAPRHQGSGGHRRCRPR